MHTMLLFTIFSTSCIAYPFYVIISSDIPNYGLANLGDFPSASTKIDAIQVITSIYWHASFLQLSPLHNDAVCSIVNAYIVLHHTSLWQWNISRQIPLY